MQSHLVWQVFPVDLAPQLAVFDGREPDDYRATVTVRLAGGSMECQFVDMASKPFAGLGAVLGPACVEAIVAKMGLQVPNGPFATWRGHDGLAMTYHLYQDSDPAEQTLLLFAFGEVQPGRYRAHVEAIWRVVRAEGRQPPG